MPNLELPAGVKVGGWTYEIRPMKEVQARLNSKTGHAQHIEMWIEVDCAYGYKSAAATLLHEIIHCILWRWDIHEGDSNERHVSALEEGLVATWIDNPEVMDWIRRGLLGFETIAVHARAQEESA